MKKSYISILLTLSLLFSCSSGNPVTPNTSSLTNLAKTPSTNPETPTIKKINLNGRVIDSITNKPIENATILVYSILNEEILKSIKNNSSGNKTIENEQINNTENKEISTSSPKISSSPNINTSTPPTQKSTPIPSPSSSIKPEENEEEVKEVQEKDKNQEKKLLDLNLINDLSKIKPNDIEEFKATTGNDGKFWINNIPENNIIITISAKGYKSYSIFNLDTSKVEDILLEPIDINEKISSFEGIVISALDEPVENATVGHSFYTSDFYGVPTNTNKDGKFKIDSILTGERLIVANLKDELGKITAIGFNNFNIKKNENSKKEEKKESNNDKEEIKNKIKLKSVTKYINFKGKVSLEKEQKLKNINVYIAFKKKGKPKEEVFLTEYLINEHVENFDLNLPELEEGYYYHLEFVLSDKEGHLVYHHENNLRKEQKEMNIKFIKPITNIASDFIKNSLNEKLPVFIWNPIEDISFYRVSISKIDKEENISTIWYGISPFNVAIYPISIKDDDNKYIWTVTGIKESKEKNNYDKLSFSKLNITTWNDLTNSMSQEIVFPDSDKEMKEIESKDNEQKNNN
ncbi:MAG: hypothetical protein KatS3mg068_1805 [Candidatus Sericytochromatia bacterium]|nr:MAG: hypothetical protein KatS3mg068_1805 [Candidatus Sericytochromatia bacterium]